MAPNLPSPGSEWIRLSDLTVWHTLWTVHPSGDEIPEFVRLSVLPDTCSHGSIVVPLADFHRDFTPNGPVTLERLEAIGWDVEGDTASYRLPFHDENHSDRLGWNESDGAFLEIGHGDRFLPGCTSMLGVLWAMRLFVTP